VTSREERIDAFVHQGEPPAGECLELLCEGHNGTYVLPFLCRWSEGSWHNATSGHLVEADVLGWPTRAISIVVVCQHVQYQRYPDRHRRGCTRRLKSRIPGTPSLEAPAVCSRRRIESGKEAVDLKGWLTGLILNVAGQAAVPIARTLLPFQKDAHCRPYRMSMSFLTYSAI
jgi:hypothetical protein